MACRTFSPQSVKAQSPVHQQQRSVSVWLDNNRNQTAKRIVACPAVDPSCFISRYPSLSSGPQPHFSGIGSHEIFSNDAYM